MEIDELAKIRLKIADLSNRLCYQNEEPEIKERIMAELEKLSEEYIKLKNKSYIKV
ncbi:hypothetical protein [Dendrosporobacter sp. 1207_IL3150]|uniref:hypothetical protein n=1 Tax=Dendrosporobacter sp. 1207_IL3150 TaxID=3084054 RepID=UPI002FDA5E50